MNQIYAKLPASNVERARAFYADKLGLTPFGEHNNHLHYEVGESYFIVYCLLRSPKTFLPRIRVLDIFLQRVAVCLSSREAPPEQALRASVIAEDSCASAGTALSLPSTLWLIVLKSLLPQQRMPRLEP